MSDTIEQLKRDNLALRTKLYVAENRVSGLLHWAAHNGKRLGSADLIRLGEGVESILKQIERLETAGEGLRRRLGLWYARDNRPISAEDQLAIDAWDEARRGNP